MSDGTTPASGSVPGSPTGSSTGFPSGPASGPSPGAAAPIRIPPQRLHPLTVLFEFLRVLGRFAYALAFILAARVMGGRSDFADVIIGAVGAVGIVVAALRYLTLRYAVDAGALVIRSGLVFRKVRAIPLDRVQNVDLRQSVLHRATGVADLKVETAAGAGAEVELSLLSLAAARRLAEILRPHAPGAVDGTSAAKSPGDAPADPSAPLPAPELLWRAQPSTLALMGATHNRAGAVIGLIFGALFFAGELTGRDVAPEDAVGGLHAMLPALPPVFVALLVVSLLLFAGWIVSIVGTIVRYFGFTLAQDAQGRLTRRFGLATQRESLIPRARVQVLRAEANLPRRLLGYWTLYVETAGSRVDQDSGGASVLCPWIAWDAASALGARVFAGLDLASVAWQPVSRATVRRAFLRWVAFAALVALALAPAVGNGAYVALAAYVPVAFGWSWARWRALAFGRVHGLLLVRGGVWTRRIWILPEGKIQSLAVSATPFQRRARLASLDVSTAAATWKDVRIPDLPTPLARGVQALLARHAEFGAAGAADGV